MSIESQSEHIWQYAMRTASAGGDVRNAPLNVVNEPSGGGSGTAETTDWFDGFASIPHQFNFHGLALSQTQSQGTWLGNESPVEGNESQKENMHLPIASGSQSPLLSASVVPASISHSADMKATIAVAGTAQSSHVTTHVTGASPRDPSPTDSSVGPINASELARSDSAPLMKGKEPIIHATPFKHKNKTVSFLSRPAQPSPPTVSVIKTMPPRINRYAPRDINPSSQDSFAGPPLPQDLNTFVRNSSILNNTFIRPTRDGELGDVFQRHTHISSISTSDPPPADDMRSVSQSQHHNEELTRSQVVLAAFDPRLSPQREQRSEPVVLAKDSQSDQDSQDSQDGGRGGVDLHEHEHTPSSASASYHLPPSEEVLVATQPSTQLAQPSMQPTQTDLLPGTVIPPSLDAGTNPEGPSPLPVPPHRRRAFAALQAARLRDTEVIPETPQSTPVPSMPPSTVPPVNTPKDAETQHDELPKDPPPRRKEKGKEKQAAFEVDQAGTTRPVSKDKGKTQQDTDVQVAPLSQVTRLVAPEPPEDILPVHPSKHRPSRPLESEVVPDSQEGQSQQSSFPKPPVPRRNRPQEGEVVPDSQEELHLNLGIPASSPDIPLREVLPCQDPPTPTPDAVKSALRKGELPTGVTHTRGRGRASSVKGKGKAKAAEPESEEQGADEGDNATPIRCPEGMDLDEEKQTDVEEPLILAVKRKRRAERPVAKEQETAAAATKVQKKYGSSKAAATTPTTRLRTRSRRHKSKQSVDTSRDRTEPANKRQRKNMASAPVSTPAPSNSDPASIRVFARRTDKGNYYHPGRVIKIPSPSDGPPTPPVLRVHFDDGHEKDVHIQFMRRFELMIHDVVHVTWHAQGKNCPVKVLEVEQWELNERAEVQELGRGPDADDYFVEGRYISISEVQVLQFWKERGVSIHTLLDKGFRQPSPNKRLTRLGFVITLPNQKGKESLTALIKASGGIVFEDWTQLVSLGGIGRTGRRVTGKADAVRVLQNGIDRLFCLTDEPRMTPKYLIALALGVPCLSIEWVLNRVAQEDDKDHMDWPAYVLPAGYNAVTRMSASQAFDRAWWRGSDNVPQLISNAPIFKPFTGKSFLCVGADAFLFTKKQLGTYPMILLAMGAAYVEAVTDVSRITRRTGSFSYTVVDDDEPLVTYRDAASVNVSWIKKCLFTGILGPVPWPDRDATFQE